MKFFGPAHHCVVVAPCIILWGTPLLSVLSASPAAPACRSLRRPPLRCRIVGARHIYFQPRQRGPTITAGPCFINFFLRSTSTIIRDELHAQSCTVPGAAVITP